MKRSKFILSVLAKSMVFIIFVSMVIACSNNQPINEDEQREISDKIEEVLKSRATIMISDEQVFNEKYFVSKSANAKEEEIRKQIGKFRDEMKKSGETYSSSRTDITILVSKKLSNSRISMKIKEETCLTIAKTGIETGYTAKHEFILEKNGSDWNIVEDKQLEPSGLLPLEIAEKYIN